jgi:FeS assembly protein IscX
LQHFSAGFGPVASGFRPVSPVSGEETGQMGLKWDQSQEIAEVLTENHPGINPLQVRFTDLRQWVADLDEFDDDPAGSSEAKLEAIQMAWNEIYEESNEDE